MGREMQLIYDAAEDTLDLIFGIDDSMASTEAMDGIWLQVNEEEQVRTISIGKASKRIDLSKLHTQNLPLISYRADEFKAAHAEGEAGS